MTWCQVAASGSRAGKWFTDDIASFLEQVGSAALQIVVGMVLIIVLVSIIDRSGRHQENKAGDRKRPPDEP